MKEYLETIEELTTSPLKENRTGIDTRGKIFQHNAFDMHGGTIFPAVTSKKLAIKGVLGELLGFIRGANNAEDFRELNCKIWDANANDPGTEEKPNAWLQNPSRKGEDDLGRIYGVQWRRWQDTQLVRFGEDQHMVGEGYTFVGYIHKTIVYSVWERQIDQLANAVHQIKVAPMNRRIIVSAWNPADMGRMALPPCHIMHQYLCEELSVEDRVQAYIDQMDNSSMWYEVKGTSDPKVWDYSLSFDSSNPPSEKRLDELQAPKYKLNVILYQRSCDALLGQPFNIASYAALLQTVAQITNCTAGTFHHVNADYHLYVNHMDAALEQIERGPVPGARPRLLINPKFTTLEDFETCATSEAFALANYESKGKLENKAPMAV